MPRIIIVPPTIILDLDDPDECDGCLMAQFLPFNTFFCPVLNRRIRDTNEDGRHPRPERCKRAFLRAAREDETDRDAEEMIGLVPVCPECGAVQNLPWYDSDGNTCPECGATYMMKQHTLFEARKIEP